MPVRSIQVEVDGKPRTIHADIPDGMSQADIMLQVEEYVASQPTAAAAKPSFLKDFQDRAMGQIGQNIGGMVGAIGDIPGTMQNEGDRIAQHVHNAKYDFDKGNYGQSLWNAVKSTPVVGGAIEQTTDRVARGQWPELTGDLMTGRLLSGPGRGMKGTPASGLGTGTLRTAGEIVKNQKLKMATKLPVVGKFIEGANDIWTEARAKTKATEEAVATAKRIADQRAGKGAPNGVMDSFKAQLPEVVAKSKAEEAAALALKKGAETAKTVVNGTADEFVAKRKLDQRVTQAAAKTTEAQAAQLKAEVAKATTKDADTGARMAAAAEKARTAAAQEAKAKGEKQGFELIKDVERKNAAEMAERALKERLGTAAEKEAGAAKELSATEAARLARQAERQAKVRATLAP